MGTHIERLLSDLESGSDDDRSVAHSCRVELDTLSRANAELRALMLALLDTGTAYTEWLETGPNFQGTVDARKAYLAACVAAHTKLTTTEAKK